MQDLKGIEEKIAKGYDQAKIVKYLMYVYFLVFVVIITLVLSLIFGSPITTSDHESWMGFLDLILIMLAAFGLTLFIGLRQFKRISARYEKILTQDCDAETFLTVATCGMEKPKPDYERNFEQALRRSYETYTLLAYQASGKFRAADEFIEHHKGLNRRTVCETRMMAAAERRDRYDYDDAFEEIRSILEATPFKRRRDRWTRKFDFIKALAYQDYNEGLKCSEKVKPENRYEEMLYTLWKGECLVGLGRLEEAKTCFEHVSKNGNTLFAKRKADKYLEEVIK